MEKFKLYLSKEQIKQGIEAGQIVDNKFYNAELCIYFDIEETKLLPRNPFPAYSKSVIKNYNKS